MNERDIERIQENEAMLLEDRIAQITAKPLMASATHCEECGLPIPIERQATIPGVQLCVSCKSDQEMRPKLYR